MRTPNLFTLNRIRSTVVILQSPELVWKWSLHVVTMFLHRLIGTSLTQRRATAVVFPTPRSASSTWDASLRMVSGFQLQLFQLPERAWSLQKIFKNIKRYENPLNLHEFANKNERGVMISGAVSYVVNPVLHYTTGRQITKCPTFYWQSKTRHILPMLLDSYLHDHGSQLLNKSGLNGLVEISFNQLLWHLWQTLATYLQTWFDVCLSHLGPFKPTWSPLDQERRRCPVMSFPRQPIWCAMKISNWPPKLWKQHVSRWTSTLAWHGVRGRSGPMAVHGCIGLHPAWTPRRRRTAWISVFSQTHWIPPEAL